MLSFCAMIRISIAILVYLDVTLCLNMNTNLCRTILDEDHYGLEDVKQSILEFIAVAKLTNKLSGKILCLVG